MDTQTSLSALLAHLKRYGLRHEVQGSAVHVHDDLSLEDGISFAASLEIFTLGLPDDLTIDGSLTLTNTDISRLPERLHVEHDLFINGTGIDVLPASLFVGKSLIAVGSNISSLPEGFTIQEHLDIGHTNIEFLPQGLVVGGEICLEGTKIQHFPSDMQVGGRIFPSNTLLDIQAFMQDRPDEMSLYPNGSGHHRLMLRELLPRFPDLERVVQALGENTYLHLVRKAAGGYRARILQVPS